MSYFDKVSSRILTPGMLLLVLGAGIVYASHWIAGKIAPNKQDTVSLVLKAAGCVVALIGTLMVLDFIG